MTFYPLASSSWGDAERAAIQRVVDSGRFTMGPEVKAFEADFANYIGVRHCVMVNSGSSANLLMVAALFYRETGALKPGDEVLVSAVSWSTTYFPLAQYGLKVRFLDIDPETLNMGISALETAISEKTRLVLAVNLLGNPIDFNALNRVLDGRDIILIEDNCESLGALFEDKQAGTFGLLGTYSTFFSHHMSTMEGGVIATDDTELYHILLSIRAHGWTRDLPKDNMVTGSLTGDAFYESFQFVLPGYNVRPLEMSGAIGREQIRKLPDFIAARRENAKKFQALFANHPLIAIQRETGKSSWFGFAMTLRPNVGVARRDLVNVLLGAGVECRPIVAGNFTKNAAIKWFDHTLAGPLRAADHVHDNGLFIGNHHFDIRDRLDQVRVLINGLI